MVVGLGYGNRRQTRRSRIENEEEAVRLRLPAGTLGGRATCQPEAGSPEKHRSWRMPVEGFRVHVATDDPLLEVQAGGRRVVGQWYSFILMRNLDQRMGGTVRWMLSSRCSAAIKRAELTAFFCLHRRKFGPTPAHVKWSDHCWAVERSDETHWSESERCRFVVFLIWEAVQSLHQEGMPFEVEHAKTSLQEGEAGILAL